jgi:TRAP-type C4-dicarboxylate transport system permease large subunit
MWIIAVAIVFGEVVGRLNIGPSFTQFVIGISESPIIFLAVTSIVILFLGCIMEGTPIILILLPFLQIAAKAYSIDPIYFGVFFIYLILVGQCTPPVAPSMFITNAIAGCSVRDYVRDGWPFLITQFLLVPVFIFFPSTITWFPDLIMGSMK